MCVLPKEAVGDELPVMLVVPDGVSDELAVVVAEVVAEIEAVMLEEGEIDAVLLGDGVLLGVGVDVAEMDGVCELVSVDVGVAVLVGLMGGNTTARYGAPVPAVDGIISVAMSATVS